MKTHQIKTVEVLQIAAGLAAALRWAIALMPLDGLMFTLSKRDWFEPVSFGMSLFFAAVEIGATAYIMRAWRKENDKDTRRTLAWLWIAALTLMTFAQVPPILANVNALPMTEYPFWFQSIWATSGIAMTFVVIGGIGYAEKSLETTQQPASDTLVTAQTTTTIKPVEIPAFIKPIDSVFKPITDVWCNTVYGAKRHGLPLADIESIIYESLNGQSSELAEWYTNGRQSISEFGALLGIDKSDEKNWNAFDYSCRGLRKPIGTVIKRTAQP